MADERIAAELVVEGEVVRAGPVRPLPAERAPSTVAVWGRQVGPIAAAATAGAAAGVAAVAVARTARRERRPPRRGLLRRRERVLSSRSFLVDVHVLGR